jgi:large subunit ribosomal protein L31
MAMHPLVILAEDGQFWENQPSFTLQMRTWRPHSERLCGATRQPPKFEDPIMKSTGHPEYKEIQVTCSCGNTFTTASTSIKPLHIEVCAECHPFYTGKQKILDTAGRVEKFRQKYARSGAKKAKAPEAAA